MASSSNVKLGNTEFRKTPAGNLFTSDIKTIFSILLIRLDLNAHLNERNKNPFILGSKQYEFSFSLQKAICLLRNLCLLPSENRACLKVCYTIEQPFSQFLMSVFMTAKLLHTPADRTRKGPKDRVLLQPTPKGIAILQAFCRSIGLQRLPDVLFSSLNTMNLFLFERSEFTDKLLMSRVLIYLLFIKLMGPFPNVWSPSKEHDYAYVALPQNISIEDIKFSLDQNVMLSNFEPDNIAPPVDTLKGSNVYLNQSKILSPLAHKFFTNPDSDSHIQYYVSTVGVRTKSDVEVNFKTTKNYVFTTKAIWQWLMDCCDIFYPRDAAHVTARFLFYGLLEEVPASPENYAGLISKNKYVKLTTLGENIVKWGKKDDTDKNPQVDSKCLSNLGQLTSISRSPSVFPFLPRLSYPSSRQNLDKILKEPGLRHLFRHHLEKEHCSENLNAYLDVRRFLHMMGGLKNKMKLDNYNGSLSPNSININYSSLSSTAKNNEDFLSLVGTCIETACNIYSIYIMKDSPMEINIDSNLKNKIEKIIIGYVQYDYEKTCSVNSIEATIGNTLDSASGHTYLLHKKNGILKDTTMKEFSREAFKNKFGKLEINNLLFMISSLGHLYLLYEHVENATYHMMETDSLTKFLDSAVIDKIGSAFSLISV
ncbi:RGS domain profile [Nakaseomyces glabratus]